MMTARFCYGHDPWDGTPIQTNNLYRRTFDEIFQHGPFLVVWCERRDVWVEVKGGERERERSYDDVLVGERLRSCK